MEAKGINKRIVSMLLILSLVIGGLCVPAESSASGNYMAFFDSQGGSYCGYKTGIPENGYITLPTPTKEGYIFSGWYTESDFSGVPYYYSYYPVTENMVFYAKWTRRPISYITAQYVGESVIINNYVDKKDIVVRAYYNDGTSFKVDPEDEELYLTNDLIQYTGNVLNYVTVHYREANPVYISVKGIKEPVYCIGFDTMGGSFVEPIIGISPGSYVQMPEKPTKKGYKFAGWYMEDTYKTAFTGEEPIYDTFIVYAKWTKGTTTQVDEDEEQDEMTINMTRANIKVNETESIFVSSLDPYLDVYYESSNDNIVSVDQDGIITGLKNGKATIWVYVTDGPTFTCEVGVGTKQYVEKINTNVDAKQVKKGKTFQIKTTITPKAVTQNMISYSSSNKKIATVSSTGLVTAKKKGVCYITVKTKDGTNLKKKIKIRVV